MKKHKHPSNETIIMWSEHREKKEQVIKVCSKEELSEGDIIEFGNLENPFYYPISKIMDKRNATVRGYFYYTIKSIRTKGFVAQ